MIPPPPASSTLPFRLSCRLKHTARVSFAFDPFTNPGLQPLVHDPNYVSVNVPLMAAEYEAGGWASDELLTAVLANPDDFYHQSHTLIHLSRDELQQSDCDVEDGGEPNPKENQKNVFVDN